MIRFQYMAKILKFTHVIKVPDQLILNQTKGKLPWVGLA